MSKPTADEQVTEGMNAYYYLCALRAEGKSDLVRNYLGSMSVEEQTAMWLGGVSVTIGLAVLHAPTAGVASEDIPKWFRMMAEPDLDRDNLDDEDDQ